MDSHNKGVNTSNKLNFDENEIKNATNNINLIQTDYFDKKSRELELSIKNQKKWFLSIRNFWLFVGVFLSWGAVVWAVCILTSTIKHYVDTVDVYIKAKEPLILWMHGLSVCSLMALIITLCLSLTRIFAKRKINVKPKTVISALAESLNKINK